MRVILAPAAAILALLAGCGPETGTGSGSIPMATSISQSDRQQGAQAKPELLQEFGGAYAGPQAGYVASVGRKIAVQPIERSERLRCHVAQFLGQQRIRHARRLYLHHATVDGIMQRRGRDGRRAGP